MFQNDLSELHLGDQVEMSAVKTTVAHTFLWLCQPHRAFTCSKCIKNDKKEKKKRKSLAGLVLISLPPTSQSWPAFWKPDVRVYWQSWGAPLSSSLNTSFMSINGVGSWPDPSYTFIPASLLHIFSAPTFTQSLPVEALPPRPVSTQTQAGSCRLST